MGNPVNYVDPTGLYHTRSHMHCGWVWTGYSHLHAGDGWDRWLCTNACRSAGGVLAFRKLGLLWKYLGPELSIIVGIFGSSFGSVALLVTATRCSARSPMAGTSSSGS